MVGDHGGAVGMAEAVLGRTEDARLRQLAETIVEDQRREIAQLREWRTRWYGDAPEGGENEGGHGSGHLG